MHTSATREAAPSRGDCSPALMAAAGFLALMFAMGVGRFAFTALLPQMRGAGLVKLGDAGVLAAINYLGYLAGALWAAFSQRGDGRRRLLGALVASAATTLAMGFDLGLPVWGALRFASGWASAAVYVYATGIVLRDLAGRGAAQWSALHYMGVGAGIALSAVVALGLGGDGRGLEGWRVLGGLAVLAFALAARCLLRPAPGQARPETEGGSAEARPRPLGWLAAAYGLAGFGYIVNATFLPVILQGQSAVGQAGLWGWMLVGLAAVPATLVWVRLSFRWGVYQALMTATLLQAVGVALPVLVDGMPAALAGAALLGGTFMGIAGLAQWLAKVPDPRATTRRIGFITACYGLGQIAGPLLVAAVGEAAGFRLPVLTAAAALVLSAGLLEISRRREALG